MANTTGQGGTPQGLIDESGDVVIATASLTTTNGVDLVAGDKYILFPNGDTWAKSKYSFIEINGTGTYDLLANTNYQALNLGNDVFNVGGAFSNVNGVITYTGDTKVFEVGFSMSGVNNETATRSITHTSIFLNGNQEVRTERFAYHRSNGDGEGSSSYIGFIELSNNDKIELRSRLSDAEDDVDILLDRTNLILK